MTDPRDDGRSTAVGQRFSWTEMPWRESPMGPMSASATRCASDNHTGCFRIRVRSRVIRLLILIGEDVLQKKPEPCWWFFFGEDFAYRDEDVIDQSHGQGEPADRPAGQAGHYSSEGF